MKVALVPARSGSKRIKGKNIKSFSGRPIIAWVIETLKNSNLFDDVLVSTDSEEIAEIARSSGARSPFLRDKSFAMDDVSTLEVVNDFIEVYERHVQQKLSHLACVYPTSVFATEMVLRECHDAVVQRGVGFAATVAKCQFKLDRILRLQNGFVKMKEPKNANVGTQFFEDSYYYDAAQCYFGTRSAWLDRDAIFNNWVFPVILRGNSFIDIDTPEDWCEAESLFKTFRRK